MNPCVILTPHFLQKIHERGDFSFNKLVKSLPNFIHAANAYPSTECMARFSSFKIVFIGEKIGDNFNVTFITCMPANFKHNVFNKAKTISIGDIDNWSSKLEIKEKEIKTPPSEKNQEKEKHQQEIDDWLSHATRFSYRYLSNEVHTDTFYIETISGGWRVFRQNKLHQGLFSDDSGVLDKDLNAIVNVPEKRGPNLFFPSKEEAQQALQKYLKTWERKDLRKEWTPIPQNEENN